MSDLATASPAPGTTAGHEDDHTAFAAALAASVDLALCDLTLDPPTGQPREDFDAAWARVDRAFAPCQTAFRNHPWALAEIQALLLRLRDGLASASVEARLGGVAVEDLG